MSQDIVQQQQHVLSENKHPFNYTLYKMFIFFIIKLNDFNNYEHTDVIMG